MRETDQNRIFINIAKRSDQSLDQFVKSHESEDSIFSDPWSASLKNPSSEIIDEGGSQERIEKLI